MSHKERTWRPVEDPLDRLTVRAKNGFQFRRREDMLMPSEAMFGFLEAAQMRFSSMKERSVKLAYGTFYEQIYKEGQCGNLEAESYTSMAIGIESSRHQGHFTEYLIMVQIEDDEDMDVLPQLAKEEIDISVSVAYDIPEIPRDCVREGWLVEKVTSFLVSKLRHEMNRLGHQRADPSWLKANMMARIRDVYAGKDDQKAFTFLEGAAEAMRKIYNHQDDPYDDQGESWDAWGYKIESFVQEHIKSFKHPPIVLEEDPVLRATRVEVPESLHNIVSAMFVATSPRVPNWPREDSGEAPFVRFRIPTLPPGLDLAATASMAEQIAENDKEAQARQTFKASIIRNAPDTTMRMELAVISDLTRFPGDTSELAGMSGYLLNFRDETRPHRITEMFPVLKVVADRAAGLNYAGSAETTLAAAPEVFNMDTLPKALPAVGTPNLFASHGYAVEALWEEFQHLDADQKAVFSNLKSLPYGMLNVVGASGTGKTHSCLLIVLMACREMAADNDQTTIAQALVCGVTNSQVDGLCERFDQLIKRCRLPMDVVRLGTMGREMNNAMNRGFEDDEADVDATATEDVSTAVDGLEISQIMRGYRENKSSQGKIHGGVYSVSEIAYAKLDSYFNNGDQDNEYTDIVRELCYIYQFRKRDPIMYITAFVERYRTLWEKLIIKIIANADICVATPVAAKQLASLHEQPFKPRVVWSDDVGRTTEAAALAPFMFFPDAQLRILSGDPESEVMTPSADGAKKPEDNKAYFVNRYALQLGTSILKRMDQGGASVSRLQVVHADVSMACL
ncbi:hypothetical protein PG993_009000 [Apiospora rasikravindrae]|uniref:DNA2/NAM7 helicase helicase domain-containing protein n=1 Tax=Apiospora rasikravindrae TaxID=990691 RepID=A0ABR1SI49_9PEZI